jgi:hypothetical protein
MPWSKLSDDFSDDCWELSDAAFRLHVEGLLWSNRKLLDLRLDKDDVRRWAKHPEAVEELVACGWWEDCGDHYRIIHHGCYQRPREAVLAQQERNQKNGQKGGRPKGPPREQAPRNPRRVTQTLTQTETQMGSETDDPADEKPSGKPTRVTQLPTHRDRTGLDRKGLDTNRGTEVSGDVPGNGLVAADLCDDCREHRPVGAAARGNDDPLLCHSCNDVRLEDMLAAHEEGP